MDTFSTSPADLQKATEAILSGCVVAHPTETCYGLACDLTNQEAVEKLFAIKKRPDGQPVSALFPDITEAKKWAVWTQQAEKLAAKFLPGPLTIILRVRPDTPELFLTPKPKGDVTHQTVGVRISSSLMATALAQLAGVPIATSSANLHGQANPYSVDDLLAQFSAEKFQPDIVLDGGVLPSQPPSTIIDCTGDVLRVVRKGNVEIDGIL